MNPRVLGALAAGFFMLAALAWHLTVRPQQQIQATGAFPGGEGPGDVPVAPGPRPAPAPASDRVHQVDRQLKLDAARALALCRTILAQPASEAERAQAAEKLPTCLHRVISDLIRARKYAEAEPLVAEVAQATPPPPQAQWVQNEWRSACADWAKAAVKAGVAATAERLLLRFRDEPDTWDRRDLFDPYVDLRLDLWRRARAAHDDDGAMKHLVAAASVRPQPEGDERVVRALTEAWPREQLVPTAERLVQERQWAVALCFLMVPLRTNVRYELKLKDAEEEGLRRKADQCRLALAQEAQAAGRFVSDRGGDPTADHLYELVAQARDPELQVAAQRGLVAVRIQEADRLMDAQKFHDAEGQLRRALAAAGQVWLVQSERPGATPWAGVPPEVVDQVAAQVKDGDARRRLAGLRSLVNEGKYVPPTAEVREVEAAFARFHVRAGVYEVEHHVAQGYAGAPARGLEYLRSAIRRQPTGADADRIAQCMRQAIEASHKKGLFDLLVELTGFYVAEIGAPGPQDGFRAQLKACLSATAENFRATAPVRRAFLLTLLADALPGDPAAESARQEALPVALEVAAAQKGGQGPAARGPSGLPGRSVHRIDNQTFTYLLVFYDGPERFFVRLAPQRRGSVVLADGKYVTAVLTTQEGVKPYQAEFTAAGSLVVSEYLIQSSGGPAAADPLSGAGRVSALGNYLLLHAPAGDGAYAVDGKSGAVTAGR